jgi:tRNA(Ile)-lysidine synthase
MIEKIKQTISKFGLLKQDDRIVVALSGGPDSTALLIALSQIAIPMNLQLVVAHFNHGLRGKASDKDESCSRILAGKFASAFISKKMNIKEKPTGFSPEDFYRRKRYEFFNEVAQKNHAHKIALGHNMNDQAETVLLHLLRGSGLDGLKGILPIRDGKYIRPLIEVSREEIISFLKERKVTYCRDSSNQSKIHLRNKIRLDLLPYLKNEFNPRIEESLAQMAEILRADNEYIRESVDKALSSTCIKKQKKRILLNVEYLCLLPLAIKRRLLKELLEEFSLQKNGITFLHINAIQDLLQNIESGRRISLPFGIEARREYENLILEKIKDNLPKTILEYPAAIPGKIYIRERKLTINLRKIGKSEIDYNLPHKDYFDLDKIQLPIVLRSRREGDWFQPLGMSGRQKLKSYFIDHKITQQKRNEILLLADQQSIVWIENMRISDRVKISRETKNVLELEIV